MNKYQDFRKKTIKYCGITITDIPYQNKNSLTFGEFILTLRKVENEFFCGLFI